MAMQLKHFLSLFALTFILFNTSSSRNQRRPVQGNAAPVVEITVPATRERIHWNTIVRYNIKVTDKEDGSSDYNEIEAKEVFLRVVYLADSSLANAFLSKKKTLPDPNGLALIKSSGCFNCHSVKGKLIGPSFEAISKRYAAKTPIDMLANKVIKGSRSVWGTIEMPPHPDLEKNNAAEIIRWIIRNGADPNIDYLPGLEGAFHTRQKPAINSGKGVYLLTASYTDHGIAGVAQKKQGSNSIVLRCPPAR